MACVMGAGPKRSPARTRARRLLLARKLVPVGDGQLVRRVTAAEKAGFTPSGPAGADAAGGKRAAWARWWGRHGRPRIMETGEFIAELDEMLRNLEN